jgi:predicted enzyme related to lactoylglutathione lyase
MICYAHTNIIARDSQKLIEFYKAVFGCKSIGQTRDIRGEWLDRLTGVTGSHIVGEHLVLPGFGDNYPTLEIFSYDTMIDMPARQINAYGFVHIAFKVDDVQETLEKLLANGGHMVGEVVVHDFPDGHKGTFVYATDIEGNIVEVQSRE